MACCVGVFHEAPRGQEHIHEANLERVHTPHDLTALSPTKHTCVSILNSNPLPSSPFPLLLLFSLFLEHVFYSCIILFFTKPPSVLLLMFRQSASPFLFFSFFICSLYACSLIFSSYFSFRLFIFPSSFLNLTYYFFNFHLSIPFYPIFHF